MDKVIRKTIEQIHASPTKVVMAITGAGSQAVAWLLSVPGASATVLEAFVPYSTKSLQNYLGQEIQQSVSEATALNMARIAYRKAVASQNGDYTFMGVSCTAAITTDRVRRGHNQAFVATWSPTERFVSHLLLEKGTRDRPAEEEIISRMVIKEMGRTILGCDTKNFPLDISETVEIKNRSFDSPLLALVDGQIDSLYRSPDGATIPDGHFSGAILSGSFNPLHDGHKMLGKVAHELLNTQIAFELSASNVDKPPLGAEEIKRRLDQFSKESSLLVSNSPLFSNKAKLFPGSTFVIGFDTATRLIDSTYYNGSEKEMYRALSEIEDYSCNFLVAGRISGGKFRQLSDIDIPSRFQGLLKEIPESKFRVDQSSSEIRSRNST